MRNEPHDGRRSFLKLATIGAFGTALPAVALGAARAQADLSVPPDVGTKFNADGSVRRFAGNTVIYHLPQQGADADAFEALLALYRRFAVTPFMHAIAPLPPSSWHMTVYGGANDSTRARGDWPTYVPLDAPMAECNARVSERLRALRLDLTLPLRMRIDPAQVPVNGEPLMIRLLPLDRAEAARLGHIRAALGEAYALRQTKPEPYHFHITLGYFFQRLSPAQEHSMQATFAGWVRQVGTKVPEIRLGAPEFCTFEDMFAFKRQFYIV